MDKKLVKAEKDIVGKTKKDFKGLLKEDKKLDKQRDELKSKVKKMKKGC